MEELFRKGIDFRSYIFNLEEKHKHNLMKYYIPIKIDADALNIVKHINKKINILGVIEPNCPDCHINLPLLEKLICINNNISLKLVTRNAINGELDRFKVDGFIKVPTFIFMDENFVVKHFFVEKPKIIKNIDVNTPEGSKLHMDYMIGKLANDTIKEFIKKLI